MLGMHSVAHLINRDGAFKEGGIFAVAPGSMGPHIDASRAASILHRFLGCIGTSVDPCGSVSCSALPGDGDITLVGVIFVLVEEISAGSDAEVSVH